VKKEIVDDIVCKINLSNKIINEKLYSSLIKKLQKKCFWDSLSDQKLLVDKEKD
jgi:hypothetical protein